MAPQTLSLTRQGRGTAVELETGNAAVTYDAEISVTTGPLDLPIRTKPHWPWRSLYWHSPGRPPCPAYTGLGGWHFLYTDMFPRYLQYCCSNTHNLHRPRTTALRNVKYWVKLSFWAYVSCVCYCGHRCKNVFLRFLFRARFLRFLTFFFILPTFFIFKNVH